MIGTIVDWQRGNIQGGSLPQGVNPARQGYIQTLNVERPYYQNEDNQRGTRNYGTQRVAVPVMGRTPEGMSYHPTFAGYDEAGEMLWDFSRPRLGTPEFNWTPTLDPFVAAERERNANPNPLGRDPNSGGTRLPGGGGTGGTGGTGGGTTLPGSGGTGGSGGGTSLGGSGGGGGGGRIDLNIRPTPGGGGISVGGSGGLPIGGGGGGGGGQPGGGGLLGPYSSWGYAPGPNGEMLPVMLGQGSNPFQTQQGGGPILPGGHYTQPHLLARMLYNPEAQGYDWFQPLPLPEQPPSLEDIYGERNGYGYGRPGYGGSGGGGGGGGDYFGRGGIYPTEPTIQDTTGKSFGLLGLPPALSGLLG